MRMKNIRYQFFTLRLGFFLLFFFAQITALFSDETIQPLAENEYWKISIDKTNLQVSFMHKQTNQVLQSIRFDGIEGSAATKNVQKSNIIVTYMSNLRQGTVNSMDSFSYSTSFNRFEITPISNGVSLQMTLGDDSLTVDDLPKMIPVEKYTKLLLPKLSSRDDKLFRDNYRVVQNKYWVRATDTMGTLAINRLHSLIFEKSEYTKGDMAEDNAEYGYKTQYVNPSVKITVEYVLDGKDILVRVPVEKIKTTTDNPVQMIEFTPYLLSAEEKDSGYFLVPDGSGALIYFNNGKTNALSYQDTVFGRDPLKYAERFRQNNYPVTLPVYGMKKNDFAVFAIIEKGAEIAEIVADISGRSNEFNRISSRFTLLDVENVALFGNQTVTTPRIPSDVYKGDIVVRYRFLSGKDANYTAMAKEYQKYLIEQNAISVYPKENDSPFFLELIGALRKTKFFLGIPYTSTVTATTLSQGKEIYEALKNAGIKNITVLFDGLFNSGVNHSALSKISLVSGIGSQKNYLDLQNTIAADSNLFAPSINMGRVYTSKKFKPIKMAARKHDGDYADIVYFEKNTMFKKTLPYSTYYISPHVISSYAETTVTAMNSFKPSMLHIKDLATNLIPDYNRKKNISRIHARPEYQNALSILKNSYDLVLDNPNSYALFAARYINRLPSNSNKLEVTDTAVPFVQLVLDGCIPYSSDSWNSNASLGIQNSFLYAIETRSAPRFCFSYKKETVFHNIQDSELTKEFSVYYRDMIQDAIRLYHSYNVFYQEVKNANIILHTVITKDVKKIDYSNGVTVYVNYGNKNWTNGSVEVQAQNYTIIKGGAPV
ncbi:MAG: DUF5696 domain-containing protein [Treponema phagedenis]|uniref:DUF5696 domain-containing protein n=1 Tax=Treponema phagedenis TaxID=162 RepID=UPI003133F650